MNIVIEDKLLADETLTEKKLLLDLAIGMYADRTVTLGRAAAIAGLSEKDFLKVLGSIGISIHYDIDDVKSDIKFVAETPV